MNLNIKQVKGELLLVSQFTLYDNTIHENRPDSINAANHEFAKNIYKYIMNKCEKTNIKIQTGSFIWELLQNEISKDEIVKELTYKYNVTKKEAIDKKTIFTYECERNEKMS